MKKYTTYEIERLIDDIEEEVRDEFDLPDDWTGDCYGSLLESSSGLNLKTALLYAKTEEDFNMYLEELKENFYINGKEYLTFLEKLAEKEKD